MVKKTALKKAEDLGEKLGSILKEKDFKDITDGIASIGAAYLGFTSLPKYPTKGALMGLISYKLATTEGNISQAAGLLGLLTIGAAWSRENVIPAEEGVNPNDFWSQVIKKKCNENEILEFDILHGWHCIPIPFGSGA